MIKSHTIAVTEIDDADAAVKQALDDLAAIPLMKNSLGIVTAHPEFVSSGIYARIAAKLPFPTVGLTSLAHNVCGRIETYMLSIFILTSDDCEFSCGASDPIPMDGVGEVDGICRKNYGEVRAALSDDPKFAILYTPFFGKALPRTDDYLSALSEAIGSKPILGATANDDHNTDHTSARGARTLICGEAYEDRFVTALVSGSVSPKFYVISITEDAIIMPKVGVVTKADRNNLIEMNNVCAVDFFKDIGFLNNDADVGGKGMLSSTFVFHPQEGGSASVSRIPILITEGGGIHCGGQITVGMVLSVAFNTKENVIESAQRLTARIKDEHAGGTAIIYSCLGRRYGLLSEPMKELEVMRDVLGGEFGYTAGYVNGEICPTDITDDGACNMFHNQTLVACVF